VKTWYAGGDNFTGALHVLEFGCHLHQLHHVLLVGRSGYTDCPGNWLLKRLLCCHWRSLSILTAIFQVLAGFIEARMMEVVVTTKAVSRAKLQSHHDRQQTNTQLFTGQIPFLSPNQQCQSTEGNMLSLVILFMKFRFASVVSMC